MPSLVGSEMCIRDSVNYRVLRSGTSKSLGLAEVCRLKTQPNRRISRFLRPIPRHLLDEMASSTSFWPPGASKTLKSDFSKNATPSIRKPGFLRDQRLPRAPRENPRSVPRGPKEIQNKPQDAPNDPQEGQNEPQEGQSELREVPGGFRERFGLDFFEKCNTFHTKTLFFEDRGIPT